MPICTPSTAGPQLNSHSVFAKQTEMFGCQDLIVLVFVPDCIYFILGTSVRSTPIKFYKSYSDFSVSLCLSSDIQWWHNAMQYKSVLQHVTGFQFCVLILKPGTAFTCLLISHQESFVDCLQSHRQRYVAT